MKLKGKAAVTDPVKAEALVAGHFRSDNIEDLARL